MFTFGNKCVKPVSAYEWKSSTERREKKDACDAGRHFKNDFLADFDRTVLDISSELFGPPVLDDL